MLVKRLTLLFVTVVGLVVTVASPALAHNTLVEAQPAKDANLSAPPAEVRLRFLSALKPDTTLTVTGPSGVSAIGTVTVDSKFIFAPFKATEGGKYTVTYALISDDGHPVESRYSFTLLTPPAPSPTTAAAQATTTPATSQTAKAAPESRSDDTPWLPWIGGAAVAGLIVGGLISFLRRRREST